MTNEYLHGRLTVCFATDVVSLAHRVQGRISFMDLDEVDHVEVLDGDNYKTINIEDVLKKMVERPSRKYTKWNVGQSLYEGAKVRVKLDEDATKRVESNAKKQLITQLFEEAKHGLYTYEEVQEILINWESEEEISV